MKRTVFLTAAGVMSLLASTSVSATSFVATGTGPITAYFYGQSAAYGSDIGLLVNGVPQGIYGLQNHTAVQGNSLVLGNANLGDVLTFELRVSTSNGGGPPPLDYSLFSDPAMNVLDGQIEHTVASAYNLGESGIPNGTLVGFEDILGGGDNDFDNHQFVFTGVTNVTPDGGSTLVLGALGMAALGMIRRKLA